MIRASAAAALCIAALLALGGCGGSENSTNAKQTSASSHTVSVEELASGSQQKGLRLGLKGPLQVDVKEITLPPGAGTGKHCHYGNLIAVVKKGTLTHYAPIYPSGVHTYHAGDSIFEGSGYVHEGKNLGQTDVVLLVTYVTPKGKPPSEVELSRCSDR